ncbi:MAG: DUF4836 family protein [Paramuribaculum sp.]|nr:DUF4836 family protein [Paramuribaculum sp.]
MKPYKNHFTGIFCLLALLLGSCSSKDTLLESVPFDAEAVATFNFIELATESGITIENGRLALPDEYAAFRSEIPSDLLKNAGLLAEAVDLENVVFFGYINRGETFATATVTDIDALRSLLRSLEMERDSDNGYEVYDNRVIISPDDNQVWICDSKKPVDRIEDFKLARKKNNILRYQGLADVLTSGNMGNFVIDQSALGSGFDQYWSAGHISIENNSILLSGTSMKTDGTIIEQDGFLEPVSTDFLRYMPSNFIFASAAGIKSGSKLFASLTDAAGKNKHVLNQIPADVKESIRQINGTVAFGFGPKSKQSLLNPASPDQWQALLMVHLPQSTINEITENLHSSLGDGGRTENGLYRFNSREFNLVYGSVDGYLTIAAGMDVAPDNSNSFTGDFTGKKFATVFQTPVLSSIVDDPSMEFSIKAYLDLNGSASRLQISLVGTEKPIIPTLVSTIPTFIQRYGELSR